MGFHPVRARRERHERELRDLELFRTVRRVAAEDVGELATIAHDRHEVAAVRAALDAATTAEQVVSIEPLVAAARASLGVGMPEDRNVRIGDRWVAWEAVGSYRGVVDAAGAVIQVPTPAQRFLGVRSAKWKDQGRGRV